MSENEIIVYNNKALVDIADKYLNEEVKGLVLPKNYDYKGAVSSLYLQCVNLRSATGELALQCCSVESIKKCVQDMITKGLNPNKKQCYPIVYAVKDADKNIIGYELQLQESYFGKKKQAYSNNREIVDNGINAQCIYKGDVFDYKIVNGIKMITKHEQKFENIKDMNIIGAYAVARFKDGTSCADIMTVEELRKSWAMSKTSGSVHQNFTHEMACKTVIARLSKQLNNATGDEALFEEEKESQNDNMVIIPSEIKETGIIEQTISSVEENVTKTQDIITTDNENVINDEIQPTENDLICSKCQKAITEKVSSFSKEKFGKPLCMSCQKEQV